MKKLLCILVCCSAIGVQAQSTKIELYDLIKKLLYDSTGYENVGDWSVGNPKKLPVKWKDDRVQMSDDTSINFYRRGTVDVTVRSKTFMQKDQPVTWSIILRGARSGYSSFSLLSTPSADVPPKYTIDSLFGKKPFTARLLKSCDRRMVAGFYYYELKLPKKDVAYLKLSWLSVNGNTALRIDCYDSWSKYAVKLDCPK